MAKPQISNLKFQIIWCPKTAEKMKTLNDNRPHGFLFFYHRLIPIHQTYYTIHFSLFTFHLFHSPSSSFYKKKHFFYKK